MNTTRRKIPQTAERLSLAFAGILVLLIGTLAYRAWLDFGRRQEQVQITRQVIDSTYALLSSLRDAETGQRNFLVTGEDRYLDPYRQALTDVPVLLERLSGFVGRDEVQRLEQLRPLIQDRLDSLAATVEVRRRQGLDAAIALVRRDRGNAIMDQIRAGCAEIQSLANRRLTQSSDAARASENILALISAIGTPGLLILLALATVSTQRGAQRREQLIDSLGESETETRRSRDWMETTLSSIGDAVITTDAAGIVTLLNPVAQSLTGWTQEGAAGEPLERVFVIRAETGLEVENPVSKVLREARVVGLASPTWLIAKDGRKTLIDDSAAPIYDGDRIAGVILVFRDVTERMKAE